MISKYDYVEIQMDKTLKCRSLNEYERNKIIEMKRSGHEFFSFSNLVGTLQYKDVELNNYNDLYDLFRTVNILNQLPMYQSLDTFYPCIFLKGNFSWVSKDDNGHYRYFTKRKDKLTVCIDLIDFLSIYYECKISLTIEQVVDDLKMRFMKGERAKMQTKKYMQNFSIIHSLECYLLPRYPELYSYMKEQLKFIETLNVLGSSYVISNDVNYNEQNIFFASNAYIKDYFGCYSASNVNKIINTLATLGLIIKVPEYQIPDDLLQKSKRIANQRNLGNIISYYVIPPMLDVLEEANCRAVIMKKAKIRYYNITKDKVESAFGSEFAETIYVHKICKKINEPVIKKKNVKIKRTKRSKEEISEKLEDITISLIKEHGFATKNMIYEASNLLGSITKRKNTLDKMWSSLLAKYNLQYIKPSNELKANLSIKNNEYLLMF